MRRVLVVVESQETSLDISAKEAELLAALGHRLASDTQWWGAEEDDEPSRRSVIVCRKQGAAWRVLIREAVGLIALDDLTIRVVPKIPLNHFLYLARHSQILPRSDDQLTGSETATDLTELVVHWFLCATERLLRGELSRGYVECQDELEAVCGQLLPLETARAYYSGRAGVACRFEEFNQDMPLNRVIKAAAHIVASGTGLCRSLRRRGNAILARTNGVGILAPTDLRSTIDRLTHHYREPLAFARYLISNAGVEVACGTQIARSFLIRTPELIEDGLRTILQEALPACSIRKRRRRMAGANLTLNPDIVVDDGTFVIDIKYKLSRNHWSRPDLYQIVAFATGFRSKAAALIYFDIEGLATSSNVRIGDLPVTSLAWNATSASTPVASACDLAHRLQAQLSLYTSGAAVSVEQCCIR
jgi:5-methylcytosine-specific restriction enzyme subunit McrC